MTVANGTAVYNVDHSPVTARGLYFDDAELSKALDGPVSAIIRDDVGIDGVEDFLVGAPETEFRSDAVREALVTGDRTPEGWRVGEALAQAYLTVHRDCTFPWPVSRDEKALNSSMPGADLVGFRDTGEEHHPTRFAFGQVKTSSDEDRPPSVMYGEHGLKTQLENLRDKKAVRKALVLYLAHRASTSAWQQKYRHAFCRYVKESTDVAVFGVMIRDVDPHQDDLRARSKALAKGCPKAMLIELYALYLPAGSIPGLGKRIRPDEEDDHASN